MKRNDIFEAMDGLSPDLVEEGRIETPSGGSRTVLTRAAKACLAAAAVLALTVTAAAASPLYRGNGETDSVEEGPNVNGHRTELVTTEGRSPDFFSGEVREIINYGIRQYEALTEGEADFDEPEPEACQKPASWDEIERMLGIDLLDSDVLDTAPPASYLTKRDDPSEDGYYIYCFNEEGEYALCAYREQYVDGMNVQLIAKVFLGEDGTSERLVPIYGVDEEPYNADREAEGRVLTMKTGKRIYWKDHGLDEPFTAFAFLESGVEYEVLFKWDVTAGASHDIHYDDVVVKVMESLGFEEESE